MNQEKNANLEQSSINEFKIRVIIDQINQKLEEKKY